MKPVKARIQGYRLCLVLDAWLHENDEASEWIKYSASSIAPLAKLESTLRTGVVAYTFLEPD